MSIEEKVKRIKAMSNTELVRAANAAADFCWDDEGAEISSRMKSGTLKCEMRGNKIVITE